MTPVVIARLDAAMAVLRSGDIADPQHLAHIRATVLKVGGAFGALCMTLSLVAAHEHYARVSPWIVAAIMGWLLGTGAYAAVRGARMRDGEFLALVIVLEIFTAASVTWGVGPGLVASTAMSLIVTVVVGTLFLERRVWVAVLPVVATVLLLVVARSAADSAVYIDVVSGTFVLTTVTLVIRLLRDMAIDAVLRARTGEVTDPLTGLANRAGLERLGGRMWRARAREGACLVLLALDVDHFKRINDTQGHAAGDDVLRRLAETMVRRVRADDLPVRLGGEEFLVVCRATAEEGPDLAERLRQAVADEVDQVTVSIGVHTVSPTAGDVLPDGIWAAVDRADRALYAAKAAGRNRVVVFADDRPVIPAVPRRPG